MSHNTFGRLFQVTTWGESHGPALGCVVDGCPPGLRLTPEDIQVWLDKRKPGGSKFVTQRQEADAVRILSGVFEDEHTNGPRTTGAPVSLMIENTDQRSKDYSDIARAYRPGHADYAYIAKYGLRDYRGGGRSSARETAARVAAGAVARKVLDGVTIRGCLVQMGPHKIDRARFDWSQVEQNPFWCPDPVMAVQWEEFLEGVRKAGSSTGAVVEVEATGVPAGWGAPVYGKLDAEIAGACMSINAAKGVEIGAGFEAAALSGEENADEMRMGNNGPIFLSNSAGGILGGISTGQPVIARVAFKPTSSILTPRLSINQDGEEIEIRTKGRHDPCVGIRAVPVVEAMVACVLADAFLRHRGQVG
jgi:chorismate synthase